jgi:CRISPR-associated protein (TIGR02710 family)
MNTFEKATERFNSYRFNDCIELLTNFDFHPDYSEKAKLLLQLTKLFDAWDKFDFNIAFEVSRNINADMLRGFGLKGSFEKLYQPTLVKLKSKKLSIEKLLDLIANAERRAAEGKYDDAIARLYRAFEMLGQLEFEKEFKCSTSDVNVENIPINLRDDVKKTYTDFKDGKVKIPLFGLFEILYKIGNETGSIINEEMERIKLVLTLRNNSILAHGTTSLDQKDFNEALDILKNITKNFTSTVEIPRFPTLK